MITNPTGTIPPQAVTTGPSGFPKVPTRISQRDPRANLLDWSAGRPEVEEQLQNLGKELAKVHFQASEAFSSLGRYEEALPHAETAVRFDPENPVYRHSLGFLRYLCGDDGAAEDFEWVVARDAGNAEAHFNLGMIRFGQGRYLEAEKAFERAAEHMPNDAETWNNLGVTRYHLGRLPEAKACFEQALRADPEYQEAKDNLKDLGLG